MSRVYQTNINGVTKMKIHLLTLFIPLYLFAEPLRVEKFNIPYLEEFTWYGAGHVTIVQGSENSLTLDGPEEALRHTHIETRGGKLHISEMQHSLQHPERSELMCTLQVRQLNQIRIEGIAQVEAAELTFDEMTISLSGGPQVTMGLKGSKVVFVCEDKGEATLTGSVGVLNVTYEGDGNFNAAGLESERVYMRLLGDGTFKVQAKGQLSVYNQGDAHVIYSGNPGVVNKKNLGKGSIDPA